MSSSFSAVFDQYNYFVWPNSSSLSSYQSADTVDALFVTNHSPAYVSSNCTCNGFKSYFTTATPKASFTFGAWGKYSVNGTQVLFDTTIDQSCPSTGDGNICFLTLHNSDGYGYNGWGTPIATVGYLQVEFDGQGTEKGILPVQYADPKPTTYIYPPAPTATAAVTSSSATSSTASATLSTSLTSSTQSLTTSSTSQALASTTTTAAATTAASIGHSKSSTSKGVVAGVAVGVSAICLLAFLAIFLLFTKRKQKAQMDFNTAARSPAHENLTSDATLVERHSSPVSPARSSFLDPFQHPTNRITPEALRDFIAAASLDRRTILNPPATLMFPGDEPSALICNIWDAIAVRETYVSRLSPSLTIPTMLKSLRKQANEIAERTMVQPPAMLAVTSTQWKGDTVGWSEVYRFKHTFAFSGGTGVTKKRLVVRRGESVGDGKKFETHERWAVGNCAECQCYLGPAQAVATMTIYVKDGAEVESCAQCQALVDTFKKLHTVEATDASALVTEAESKRAELARQAVEREWERMEQEYRTRERNRGGMPDMGGKGSK